MFKFVLFLLLFLCAVVLALVVRSLLFFPIPKGMTLILGAPGSGKTTLASFFCKKFLRCKKNANRNVFSNVPIVGTKKIVPTEDMGKYLIEDGLIVIDEGGIVFNNRHWKKLDNNIIEFAKLYRHYGLTNFIFFSQGLDIDVTFQRLCDRICIVRKSLIPYFIVFRDVKKVITIDDVTHQLIDAYCFRFAPFGTHYVFAPLCWSLFDTYDAPKLPSKQFPIWNNKTLNGGKTE